MGMKNDEEQVDIDMDRALDQLARFFVFIARDLENKEQATVNKKSIPYERTTV